MAHHTGFLGMRASSTHGPEGAASPKRVAPPNDWQDMAACFGLDPEIFFPTTEEEAAPALSYCATCRVRDLCLAWALQNGERYGVWGGTTEQMRRRLIREVA